VVAKVQELYEVVYQKKEIINGTIGVTFVKFLKREERM
jgi:hypothetical protein